jgi:hypothetical protein
MRSLMNDHTLDFLASFRADLSDPDDATVAKAYRFATAGDRSRRPVRTFRGRLTARSRVVIAIAVVALAVVPAAVAFGGRIVDFFEGSPPTNDVSTSYETLNRVADQVMRQNVRAQFPHADLSTLHGVVETQTVDGPLDLWTAANNFGGQCWFVDYANDPASGSGKFGGGGCDTATPPASKMSFEDRWSLRHSSLLTVDGHIYTDATRVVVTLADGTTHEAPVVEHYYLLALDRNAYVTRIDAYNDGGDLTATWTRPDEGGAPSRQTTGTDTAP